jgi:predicted transcriptional regulator
MSYGYSQSLVQANKSANAKSLGVALGRLCIQSNVSVAEVADMFGVSRMTVYNWFRGVSAPRSKLAERIKAFITKHR